MEELITPEALITVPVASGVVALILFILRGVFGTWWTDRVNRIAGLILSVGVIEGAMIRLAPADWWTYVGAGFTGLIVSWAVITGGDTLIQRIITSYGTKTK